MAMQNFKITIGNNSGSIEIFVLMGFLAMGMEWSDRSKITHCLIFRRLFLVIIVLDYVTFVPSSSLNVIVRHIQLCISVTSSNMFPGDKCMSIAPVPLNTPLSFERVVVAKHYRYKAIYKRDSA